MLVRVTRNCPWNKCAFCHSYKDQLFSRRSVEEVKADIDNIHAIAMRIDEALGGAEVRMNFTPGVLRRAIGLDDTPEYYYKQVAFWMGNGCRNVFLQDANSLVLPTPQLVEIITHLKSRFPAVERITSYARAKTLSKKTVEELKELRNAGLTRLHLGMESGCDEVLDCIRKGVHAEEQVIAGRKVIEAGFDLSEYYMPGIGGRERWRENAVETAKVLNRINPTYIRLRSTVPVPGTPLHEAMGSGEWTPLTELEKMHEIRLFIEHLDGITSEVKSDHMMNLLEDVEGKLPGDKEKMLSTIDAFLEMDEINRDCYTIGRRLGYFRSTREYTPSPELEGVRLEIIRRFGTSYRGYSRF
jgi:radical SAM superfamily enzyme YgiQ (UPF0313 family)